MAPISDGPSARVLYALSRDGHLPRALSRLHRRHRTPHLALAICAALVIAFGCSGIVRFVASMADFGYLMGLSVVNYAVVSLHQRMPNLRRPFSAGWFPYVPVLGVISCLIFVPSLELRSLLLGAGLTLVGAVVYLARIENRAFIHALPTALSGLWLRIRALRRHRMRVVIIGGGRLGKSIADQLLASDEGRLVFRTAQHQVTFVEEDRQLCDELEKRYSTLIYQGDGTEIELPEQVGKGSIDVLIAALDDDGRTVVAALEAKRLGVGRVMAIIQDPDYHALLASHGVIGVSVPRATATVVENYLERPDVADLVELQDGVANVVSLVVPEDARVGGTHLRDIDIPRECVVGAVIRDREFVVPRGDTQIRPRDHVILIGPTAATRRRPARSSTESAELHAPGCARSPAGRRRRPPATIARTLAT